MFPENWHFNSRFVLKTTKTLVFVFITEILWQTFWCNNWRSVLDVVKILRFRVHQFKTSANKKRSVCCHDSSSAKPAQVGADYPRANDRTIFWPMLAHTADRQQLGSSPGFTFQEVGVCVVPMNQEETRSLEIFDIVYSSGLSSLGVPGVQWHPKIFADQFTLY